MDYSGLTAWATLLAVIVALGLGVYPIMKDRRERKAEAESLREELSALLHPIMVKWQEAGRKRVYDIRETKPKGSVPPYVLKQEDREQLVELRSLYPELNKLTTKERLDIKLLYHRMSTSYLHETLENREVTFFEKSIRDILNEMGRFDAEGKFKA